MESNKNKESEPTINAPKFRKGQILSMRRYANRRDLLGALLQDGRSYTHDEIHARLREFEKGKVK